jgi:hypothetical protein
MKPPLTLSSCSIYSPCKSIWQIFQNAHPRLFIDVEAYKYDLRIFTACAIEYEGLQGTNDNPIDSVFLGCWVVTSKNYVIRKVKCGVKAFGNVLGEDVGMNNT